MKAALSRPSTPSTPRARTVNSMGWLLGAGPGPDAHPHGRAVLIYVKAEDRNTPRLDSYPQSAASEQTISQPGPAALK